MTEKYTMKELINCVYYESSLEILSALKMIIDNGLDVGGNIDELCDNILPQFEDEKFVLNPMNRMMLRDLYNRVYHRVTDEPKEEAIEFIKGQAKEFQEVVIDEVKKDKNNEEL